MARGRIPIPTVLNSLRGDPGKRRKNTKEPEPLKGYPDKPDYLDEIASKEWDSICHLLNAMHLLSKSDKTILEMYCSHYSRWRKAQSQVAKSKYGAVILSPDKKFPMKSPFANEADKQQSILKGILIELGLTPAARARMGLQLRTSTINKPKLAELVA